MAPLPARRKLPIGIQSFRKIREGGFYYVDKTPFIAALAEGANYYFLSRPRRFGKSLFLDTLAAAFAGERALFTAHDGSDGTAPRPALYLADHWDWEQRYPVVRISFGQGIRRFPEELDEAIAWQLETNAARLNVPISQAHGIAERFADLITAAAEAYRQRTVVLVDEYDKPILDHITRPDLAAAMRERLRNFYSVLKERDADLHFVFLTGVSKFSKVSLFSGLNNLADITLIDEFATLCGYTESDLDTVFAPEFVAAEQEGCPLSRSEVRAWYNGYWWKRNARVYNPFDVLQLLRFRTFRPWWFESGTPTFLVELLKERAFFTPRLERLFATEALLSSFDVEAIEPEALLWQTGYLTIADAHSAGGLIEYELTLPNTEVRTALNQALTHVLLPSRPGESLTQIVRMLQQGDSEGLQRHFVRLFASISHDWYRNNPIAQYEGYFASVCYSHLASLGLPLKAEAVSEAGQVDLVIEAGATVWVIEFKVVSGDAATGEALAQIQARDYAAPYRGKPGVARVIELGVEFSKTRRTLVGWHAHEWVAQL